MLLQVLLAMFVMGVRKPLYLFSPFLKEGKSVGRDTAFQTEDIKGHSNQIKRRALAAVSRISSINLKYGIENESFEDVLKLFT